ncbi:MAG: M15 family metallopeptidase [Muricauda sp.]|nr:M15 family metallopeptidase [Allomuricauda sp.]
MKHWIWAFGILMVLGCREKVKEAQIVEEETAVSVEVLDSVSQVEKKKFKSFEGLADTTFVRLADFSDGFAYDLRYATENNFTESQIYDCARCYLRKETAEAIVRAQQQLRAQGLGLKLFDCYRPKPYQQRLWDKVPNPDYVAPPSEGSMHSRGAAVDLTIVDANGNELDMGTPYDFFGREAHYNYSRLPGKVIANRRLLRKTMESVGLNGIRTEWWHFSYQKKSFPLEDWVWKCPAN